MPAKIDLTGQVFDRLTVLREVPTPKPGAHWLCLCQCGAESIARSNGLRTGAIRSCGCLRVDVQRARRTTHGMNSSPEYSCWENMIQRCTNPGSISWPRYGAKGVSVHPAFQSFEGFLAEIGPRPSRRHSIDRYPRKKGHYEPGNVRWATRKQQQRNLSSNVLVEWLGRTQCIAEWAEEVGLPYHVLRSRLQVYGWSVEKALTTPKGHRSK